MVYHTSKHRMQEAYPIVLEVGAADASKSCTYDEYAVENKMLLLDK